MATTLEINAKEKRNDKFQVVFFTLSANGEDYEFSHGAVPINLDTDSKIKAWLIERKDRLYYMILRKQFPGADTKYMDDPDKSDIENFLAWVQFGHKNKIGEDEHGDPIYQVIEKVPLKSNHPRWIKAIDEIEAISSLADAKVFLKKIVRYISR